MVTMEERDIFYWIRQGSAYQLFRAEAMQKGIIGEWIRAIPTQPQVDPDPCWQRLPNMRDAREVEDFERKITEILTKCTNYTDCALDHSKFQLPAEDCELWVANVLKNFSYLLGNQFNWSHERLRYQGGIVSFLCGYCHERQTLTSYGWPRAPPRSPDGRPATPFHRCPVLKASKDPAKKQLGEDILLAQVR